MQDRWKLEQRLNWFLFFFYLLSSNYGLGNSYLKNKGITDASRGIGSINEHLITGITLELIKHFISEAEYEFGKYGW